MGNASHAVLIVDAVSFRGVATTYLQLCVLVCCCHRHDACVTDSFAMAQAVVCVVNGWSRTINRLSLLNFARVLMCVSRYNTV